MRTPLENTGFLLAKAAQRWNELLVAAFTREGIRRRAARLRIRASSALQPRTTSASASSPAKPACPKQTMTSMLAQMERDGLVERTPDPSDRRATRVRLAAHGRAFQPVADAVLAELDTRVAAAIPASALATTHNTLKELIEL